MFATTEDPEGVIFASNFLISGYHCEYIQPDPVYATGINAVGNATTVTIQFYFEVSLTTTHRRTGIGSTSNPDCTVAWNAVGMDGNCGKRQQYGSEQDLA